MIDKIRERLQDVIDTIEVYTAGRPRISNAKISVMRLQQIANKLKGINQVEAEYKDINIITDYLQYVRDNANNYDTENGWSLADLLDLSIKFSEEAEYNNGWISVDDRLPEEMQRCLVTQRIYVVPDHVDEPDNFIGIKFNTYTKQL